MLKNIKGAETFIDDKGLFTATAWNFFDWANIDQDHKTVLHNTFLLIGALDAAINCAHILEDDHSEKYFQNRQFGLKNSLNKYWNDSKKTYPDSIHENGTVSSSSSQHTSFLAVLYDVIEKANLAAASKNLLNPPSGMIRAGSPFAMFYMYEALEKLGLEDEIIQLIRSAYLPMIEIGATTVWESFSTGTQAIDDFPTRSHCHAWSASPLYYLPRIILGIKQMVPGGKMFQISPRLNGLLWAKGSVTTKKGQLSVEWYVKGSEIIVNAVAPTKDIKINFIQNKTHKNLRVKLYGFPS